MSEEWKYRPQSTRRAKSSQPARFEENEPFLRPMTSDQLFRPDSFAPVEAPAQGRALTHRQAAASMREAQRDPRQAAFSGYAYGQAPSGYASIPQPMPYYPQPGYMPYPAPMGGYYAVAPTGPWQPYPDPYAYSQPPYGAYPPYGGQPPMGVPGYPQPYAPAYMPYPQAGVPQGTPTYPTPAAPPSMQVPLPIQESQPRPEAVPPPPPQSQPMTPPSVEAIPQQAVLQTFPPASIPSSMPPPKVEDFSQQEEPARAEAFYPTPALRNYAADYEPEEEIQQVLGLAHEAAPLAEPAEGPAEFPLYPPVADFLTSEPEPEVAAPLPEPWAEVAQPERPAPQEELSGVVQFEPLAAPPPLAQPVLPQTPFVHAEEVQQSAQATPVAPHKEESPVVQAVAVARAIPVPLEETPAQAVAYATPQTVSTGHTAQTEDWEDDDFDDDDLAGDFREAPQPLPVPSAPTYVEEEKGHSGFITFLLTLTLLISLAVVYFTGVADEVLMKVGIPVWNELTVETDEVSNTPRIFSDAFAAPEGTVNPGSGAIVSTPELAPASAAGAPRLLSMDVEPSTSKAPATLIFTLKSNTAVANVQLRNGMGDILLLNESSTTPVGDSNVWKCTVEFEEPYQGLVTAYLSDGSGQWTESGYSCPVTVQ